MKTTLLKFASVATVAAIAGALIGYQFSKRSHGNPLAPNPSSQTTKTSTASIKQLHTSDSPTEVSAGNAIGEFADPTYQSLSFRDRVKLALSYDSPRKQNYAVELLFEDMDPEDAPAMLEVLMEEPDSNQRRSMLRPFFVVWGKHDGEQAVQVATSLSGREKSDALSAAFAGWGQSDPYKAWEAATPYLEGGSYRQVYIIRGAFHELASQDLQSAIDAVPSEGNRMLLSNLNGSLVQAAFKSKQTDVLLQHVLSMEDADQSKQLLSRIFHQWGENDTDAPLNALAQFSDPKLAQEAMSGFIQGWMQSDREGALDYVIDNRSDSLVGDSIGTVVRQAFFEGTESENKELLQRLEQENLVEEVAPMVVRTLSFSNPELAISLAERISDADQQTTFQSQALSGWANNNLNAALAYHKAIEDPIRRTELAPSLVYAMPAKENGPEMVGSLFSELPAGKERTKAVEKILGFASSPYGQEHPDFVIAVAEIAAAEPDLSEDSQEQLDKILAPKN